jgi:hypothetical protein
MLEAKSYNQHVPHMHTKPGCTSRIVYKKPLPQTYLHSMCPTSTSGPFAHLELLAGRR